MMHHSGSTILFRPDHAPTFCQRLGSGYNPMHLRLFEKFGTDGPANKVWNRLFTDVIPICSELRVVTFIHSTYASKAALYIEEYCNCKILSENPPDPKYEGTMDIISEVTISCAEIIRQKLPNNTSGPKPIITD
jgi:hypothetical protein